MIARLLQFISVAFLLVLAGKFEAAELQSGDSYRLNFRDVDGNDLSTADGHITIMTVVTRQNEAQAYAVAEQVPDHCTGDPRYRYVTLVNFQRKLARPFRGLTQAIIRRRLEAEAKKLKPQYEAKRITRDPRRDLYVVSDFDGAAVAQLGLNPDSNEVAVFIFEGEGKLIGRWAGVPPADALPKAIATAES